VLAQGCPEQAKIALVRQEPVSGSGQVNHGPRGISRQPEQRRSARRGPPAGRLPVGIEPFQRLRRLDEGEAVPAGNTQHTSAGWFAQIGSKGSAGTKLLSVSGDCSSPGVYEVPFGLRLRNLLEMVGGEDALAVQMGGASGRMVSRADFERIICFDDLATGGSVMVFGPQRHVPWIALKFLDFFVEENCGFCTPCRVGNVLLKQKLEEIIHGRGQVGDLEYLEQVGALMKTTSRCGLGQTAPVPVLSSIQAFRPTYEALLLKKGEEPFLASFDIQAALRESQQLTGRASTVFVA